MMFAYEVKSLSDFSEDEIKIDTGVMSAPSMSDAAKIIEDYYAGFLISANLTYLDCSSRNMVLLDNIKNHFHLTEVVNS